MKSKKRDLYPLPATLDEIFNDLASIMASFFSIPSNTVMTQEDFDKVDNMMLFITLDIIDNPNTLENLNNVMWNNLTWLRFLVGDYMYILPEFQTMPLLQTLIFSCSLEGQTNTTPIGDYNYPNLTSLTINGSYAEVPDFSKMPKLEKLDLSYNQLTVDKIPDFSHISNLKELSFSYNHMPGAMHDFTHLPQLTSLDLSMNGLYELPETPLSNPNCEVNFSFQLYEFPNEVVTKVSNDTFVDLPIYFQLETYGLVTATREIIDGISETTIKTQGDKILFETSQLPVGTYSLAAQINDLNLDPDYPNEYIWNLRITE